MSGLAARMGFEGRVIAVAGAGSDVGAAAATVLSARGAIVALIDRDGAAARQVEMGLSNQSMVVQMNVCDEGEWRFMCDQIESLLGPMGGFVNAVRAAQDEDRIDGSVDAWAAVLGVQLDAAMFGCREAVRRMRLQGGAIVNVVTAQTSTDAARPAMAAAGGAVRSLSRSVAARCAEQGWPIRCNLVAARDGEEQAAAAMIAYLLSDEAGFVAGAEFPAGAEGWTA